MTNLPALTYNGQLIHQREKLVSLTDMWRAAGGDPTQAPAQWMRSEECRRFSDFLKLTLNVGESHIWEARRGRHGGGTYAHWQIGLAYAQYLSPEFHVWCNTVIRAAMEGDATGVALAETVPAPAQFVEGEPRQLVGMVKSLVREVAVLKRELAEVKSAAAVDVKAIEHAAVAAAPPMTRSFLTALEILKANDVPAHGRRGLPTKCSDRLRAYYAQREFDHFKHPETGRWMFYAPKVEGWLALEGRRIISEHMARITGQGFLRLVPKA